MAKLTLNNVTSGYGTATRVNANNTLIETAIENTLSRDGTAPNTMSAVLDMNSNRVVNVANATGTQDAVPLSQVNTLIAQSAGATTTEAIILTDGRVASYISGVAGADTITGGVTPTLTSYVTGQMFVFFAAGTNTTTPTLSINGLAAKQIRKGGGVVLVAGDLVSGYQAIVIYNGTSFILLNPFTIPDTYTYNGAATFNGVTQVANANGMIVASATPSLRLQETDASVNNKIWQMYINGETLVFRITDDSIATANNFMVVDRTGTTVDSVSFPTTTAGAFIVGGAAVGSSVVGINGSSGVNALALKVPSATTESPLALWNSATAGNNMFVSMGTETGFTGRGSIDFDRSGGLVRYLTSSDRRLKTNIQDALSVSSIIDSIRVRSFDWIDSGNHLDHWLIAQELYEVVPVAVAKGDDGETIEHQWSVDATKLIPLLIKELQDLRKRVAELETA